MNEPGKSRSHDRGDSAFPESIRKHYSAPVSGDGRVLPILESVGRRLIREIDPASPEGQRLLESGRVALWSATKGGPRRAAEKDQPGASEGAGPQARGKSRRLSDS